MFGTFPVIWGMPVIGRSSYMTKDPINILLVDDQPAKLLST